MTTSEPVMGAPVTTASLPPDSDPDRHSTITGRAAYLARFVANGVTTVEDVCRALAEAEARADLLRAQLPDQPRPVDRPALPATGPVWWGDVVPHPEPEDYPAADYLAARATMQAIAHHQAFTPAAIAFLADTSPATAAQLADARARHLQTAHAAYTAAAALRGVPARDIADAIDYSTCWHDLEDWAAEYLDLDADDTTELVARITLTQTGPGGGQ